MQLVSWLRTLNFAARPFAGRTGTKRPRSRQPACRRLLLEALEDRVVPSTASDFLYVGDGGNDNTVQQFDAATGANQTTFVGRSDSLKGPRGAIFDGHGHFLLANQNVGRGKPGDIMEYDAATGQFQRHLVSFQDANAPFAPRGMVLKDNILYVANMQDTDSTKAGIAPNGEVDRYNATTGQFLGGLAIPAGYAGQFNPRAVVFGPDGNLYVSVFDSSNLNAGYVVRYAGGKGTGTIFASDAVDADLHRPEGLTFGPDGRLYVTGFRASATDTDKIVILNTSGAEVDSIALDAVGQPRAYGQSLLFGPSGHLFVPIVTPGAPDLGAVRSYDVAAKTFTNFEAPGTMDQPWYMTFGNTDPATLAYNATALATSNSATLAAALMPSLSTSTSTTVAPTSSGDSQAGSPTPSTSSAASVAATSSSVTPAAGAASTGTNDLLFAAWADDLLVGTLS